MTAETSSVWLVGGRGMLAHAFERYFETRGVPWVSTDSELDLTNREAIHAFARELRPRLIINAAAYTRVDDAEANEALASRVNGDGVENLAGAALALQVPLLHFSTDYVFDGRASSPYREDAPTQPRSAYGRSKLLGEQKLWRVLSSRPELGYVVRTSWLFGPRGANFVKTMVALMREREELRVVDDQRGRPTFTADLAAASAELVGLAGTAKASPGTYHFANSGDVTWYGFTLGILGRLQELGIAVATKRVTPVTTREFPRPAERPAYSVLDTTRIEAALGRSPRSWRETLVDYLNEPITEEK